MKTVMIRRRTLGKVSCEKIAELCENEIEVIRNDIQTVPEDTDLVIRWGCTANINGVKNVVNTAKAIHLVNNKREFRELLSDTDYIPKTFSSCEEWFEHVDKYRDVIFRPAKHSQGKNLLKITVDEYKEDGTLLDDFVDEHPDYYISEYINKVSEFRVFIVSGRVACVANKIPADADAIAWNVAQGGKFENVKWSNWNLQAIKVAIKTMEKASLDFGGVDIMMDANNKPYVLEINSAPSLTSPYRQQCMAKCFDYIIENGKEIIPLIKEKGGYKKFIHPAVCEDALM